MSLQGKVVLITGASNGIGKACAERLAKQGASVVINYYSDATSANNLVQAIGGDRAVAIQADVSTLAGIEKLVSGGVEKFGKLDIVMANAATMSMRTVQDTTESDFDNAFAMNVKGPYFLVQVCTRKLRALKQVLTIRAESHSVHGPRISHHPGVHGNQSQLGCHAELFAVCGHEGCHRSNDASYGQGAGS